MRILTNRLALLVAATIAIVGAGVVRAEDAPKEVTLTGTMQCAKCSLHEAGVTTCTDVLTVKDGDKTVNYYIIQDGKVKTASHVCKDSKDGVSVTGVVSEKDGKKTIAASKIDAGGTGAHDH
jgi:hypothetical protein